MKNRIFRALLVAFVFGVVASMSISAQNAGLTGAKSDNTTTVQKEEPKQDLEQKKQEVEQKVAEQQPMGCCG